MKKLISLRNIPRREDPSANTIVKSAIVDLAEILNVEFSSLELFFHLITSNREEKLLPIFDELYLDKIEPNMQDSGLKSFIHYASSICEKLELRHTNISNINKNIFSDFLPSVMCNKILFSKTVSTSYEEFLQVFSVYCGNGKIPNSIISLIDFRYGIVGTKKADIFRFLNPMISQENFLKSFANFNVISRLSLLFPSMF